jgi:hypothetical protein
VIFIVPMLLGFTADTYAVYSHGKAANEAPQPPQNRADAESPVLAGLSFVMT